MTVTEVQQETGWGKRGDTWVPPTPVPVHGHGRDDLAGIWDPGDIKWSARTTAAPGWLKCDGSLKPINQHRRLFEAIGFAYSPVPGTDPGGGNFHLPPPGRMPVGLDPAQVEFDTLGERGGSKTSTAPHDHSMQGHTHSMQAHTHYFESNYKDTNHAHNVYATDHWVGTMNVNVSHNHGGSNWANIHWTPDTVHSHSGRGGIGSEAPWHGAQWASAVALNIVGNDINHQHHTNHNHPSTNYASESPWPGNYNHRHEGTTAGPSAGDTSGPNTGNTGASSAGVASGNLPPYVVFNCFIKT